MALWKSGAAVCRHCGLGIFKSKGILGSVWLHTHSRKGRCHGALTQATPR